MEKTKLSKEQLNVVNFTYDKEKGIQFKFLGYQFSILDDFNPKTPDRALFVQKGEELERISGLFPSLRGDILRGDVKKKGERQYFQLQYLSKSQFYIQGLNEALSFKGIIPTKRENDPILSPLGSLQGEMEGGSLCIS